MCPQKGSIQTGYSDLRIGVGSTPTASSTWGLIKRSFSNLHAVNNFIPNPALLWAIGSHLVETFCPSARLRGHRNVSTTGREKRVLQANLVSFLVSKLGFLSDFGAPSLGKTEGRSSIIELHSDS